MNWAKNDEKKSYIVNDRVLMLCYVLLLSISVVSMYAIEQNINPDVAFLSLSSRTFKQFLWIVIAFVFSKGVFYFLKNFEYYSYLFYALGIVLLCGLFFFGREINGATSWYQFGSVSFQPSEFVKITTAMALAYFISRPDHLFSSFLGVWMALFIIALPATLIVLQPDAGSLVVFVGLIFALYRGGMHKIWFILLGMGILLFVVYLFFGFWGSILVVLLMLLVSFLLLYFFVKGGFKIFLLFRNAFFVFIIALGVLKAIDWVYTDILKDRHKARFEILTGKREDNRGVGYNLHQSLIAIKSGGFSGKGFLNGGHTQGMFIPEQHTDYVFTYICEEWGFMGGSFVILIYTVLILRIVFLSNQQKKYFNCLYGYALAGILTLHYFINIGMVCGILPTIGIPLPLVSYGGSSVFAFSFFLLSFATIAAKDQR